MLLLACDSVEVVTPDASSVSISPSAITIDLGERTRLVAAVFSNGGATAGAAVSWSSDDATVVSVDQNGEIVGLSVGTATISARSGGGTGTAQVTVRSGGSVVLDRQTVSFTAAPGGVAGPEIVEITSPGPDGMSGLAASVTYTPGQTAGWLRAALSSTSTPASLLLSADARSLAVGTYTATIDITSTGATGQAIAVTLQVLGAPATLALNSENITFAANESGSNPQQQKISLTNSGTGTLGSLSTSPIVYGAGQPTGWLTVALSTTTAPAEISLNAVVGSRVQGTYTASFDVISPDAANSPRTVTVTFDVTAPLPIIALNPTTLSFTAVQGGPAPTAQPVAVTNGGVGALGGLRLSATYTGGSGGWIATALSRTVAPATATISINHAGLAPGTYTGVVNVNAINSANAPLQIPVDLTVTASPVMALSRSSVTFTAAGGQPNPPAASVVVTNSGGSLLDGLSVDSIRYTSGQRTGWLSGSLSFPLTPSTLVLAADITPSGGPLAFGTYNGVVFVGSTAAGVTNSPRSVAVTLLVANSSPVATITQPSAGQTFRRGSVVSFAGTGTDPEEGTLTGSSLVWTSSRDGALGTGTSFSVSTLSAGSHVITLAATDSQGQRGTATVNIAINDAPTATITAPATGATFALGASVPFAGTGSDPEDGALSGSALAWNSSIGGALGTGTALPTTTLALGTHTIRLVATDSQGAADTASISVQITSPNTAPVANAGPDQNLSDPNGSGDEPVTLDGRASSDAEGPLASFVWDTAGTTIATAANPTVTLPVGQTVIQLTVTDNQGATDVDTVVVNIGSNAPPTATITAPAPGAAFLLGATVTFQGTGTDVEDGPLTGTSLTWSSNVDGALGTGVTRPVSTLTAGTHTITLTARDSGGVTGTATITVQINVPANTPPTATITGPTSGSAFVLGAVVPLTGTGADAEDGPLTGASLAWSSSIDGPLGTGTSRPVSTLSAGTHTITLTATDSGALTGTAAITVQINVPANTPPTATITGPASGSVFQLGASVPLAGTGSDPEDGPLSGASLAWSSNVDGPLGIGASLPTTTLTAGPHTITLTATDSGALTGTAAIAVQINVPANSAPTATITSPASGAVAVAGATVTLAGVADDAEDGPLSGAALVWSSNLDGRLGSGLSFPTTALSIGSHKITLTATDSGLLTGTDTVTVQIDPPPANTPPTATVVGPASGSVYLPGASVPLSGTASDAEDGPLTGAALSWDSSLDGPLGSGGSLPTTTLTAGTHTITLTATDTGLLTGTDAIIITINTPPVAAISAPTGGASFVQGTSITFTGSGTDTEDGPLTGVSLVWSSDLDGALGTGVTFANTTLTVGVHTISLVVTDAAGDTDTAVITVTIT